MARDRRTPQYLMLFALLCAAPLLIYMQRDSVPWADEWSLLLYWDSWSPQDLLRSFNGHLMPVAALIFKLNGAIFYPGAQLPLTIVSVALQLTLAWTVFIYVRRRIDNWAALGLASLLLFYGSGYEVIAWSMNIGWLASLAAGMGALALFDLEPTRRRSIGVAALLLLSLMGCNIGLVFVAAIAIRAIDKSDRRRAVTIVAPLIILWSAWWVIDTLSGGGVSPGYFPKSWPQFIRTLVEYSFGGLVGIAPGEAPTWGAPLAVAGVAAGIYALAKLDRVRAEVASVIALPIVFWILTAIGRGGWSGADASRYTYTSFVLLIPVLAVLARGFKIRGVGLALGLAGVWLVLIAGNLTALAAGSFTMRLGYVQTRAHLTALVKVGEPVACATKFNAYDPGINNSGNCVVRAWVMKNGPERFTYSAAELANPANAAAVNEVVKQIQEQTPGAGR